MNILSMFVKLCVKIYKYNIKKIIVTYKRNLVVACPTRRTNGSN